MIVCATSGPPPSRLEAQPRSCQPGAVLWSLTGKCLGVSTSGEGGGRARSMSALPWSVSPAPAALPRAPLQRCRGRSTLLCGAERLRFRFARALSLTPTRTPGSPPGSQRVFPSPPSMPLRQLQSRSPLEGHPRVTEVLRAPGHRAVRTGSEGGGAEGAKRGGGAGAGAPHCPARDFSPSAAAAAAAEGRGVEGGEKGWRPGREGGRGGGAAGLCQGSRRGARRSPALLPGARMRTLKLALLG